VSAVFPTPASGCLPAGMDVQGVDP
jgi:hypothetical protein